MCFLGNWLEYELNALANALVPVIMARCVVAITFLLPGFGP